MTFERPPYKDLDNPPKIVKYLHDCNPNHPVYERQDITHGVNCSCCTKIEVSERLAEQWQEKIRELHKGRNERRRLAKISRIQQLPAKEERDNWNPLGMEDFEL